MQWRIGAHGCGEWVLSWQAGSGAGSCNPSPVPICFRPTALRYSAGSRFPRTHPTMAKPSEPDQTLIKMPSLRAVRSFVAAAKYQSFTRAAEALCVTQAAISRQIKELEEHLGCELFIRAGRNVKLSPEGSVFYDAAQLSFINISQAAERLRIKNPLRQLLTICCSPAFASLWMQHRLPSFLKEHPDIELTLIATQDFLAMETGVQPDIFITKMNRVREGYTSTRMFHDVIYPVCTERFLAQCRAFKEPQDLREAMLLDLSPYGRSQLAEHVDWKVWLALHDVDVSTRSQLVHQSFSSNDYNTVVQLAMADQGIALGWDHLVGHLVASGRLVRPIPHSIVHTDRCHYLSVREELVESEACLRFRNWLMGQL